MGNKMIESITFQEVKPKTTKKLNWLTVHYFGVSRKTFRNWFVKKANKEQQDYLLKFLNNEITK